MTLKLDMQLYTDIYWTIKHSGVTGSWSDIDPGWTGDLNLEAHPATRCFSASFAYSDQSNP